MVRRSFRRRPVARSRPPSGRSPRREPASACPRGGQPCPDSSSLPAPPRPSPSRSASSPSPCRSQPASSAGPVPSCRPRAPVRSPIPSPSPRQCRHQRHLDLGPLPSPLDTSAWKTYTSDRYGFTIAYPPDWSSAARDRGLGPHRTRTQWPSPGWEQFLSSGRQHRHRCLLRAGHARDDDRFVARGELPALHDPLRRHPGPGRRGDDGRPSSRSSSRSPTISRCSASSATGCGLSRRAGPRTCSTLCV